MNDTEPVSDTESTNHAESTEHSEPTNGIEPTSDTDRERGGGTSDSEVSSTPVGKAQRRKRAVAADEESGSAADEGSNSADDAATAETATAASDGEKAGGGRQVSFTITGSGLLKALAALIGIALVAGVALLGWGYHQQSQRIAAFDETKVASEKFVQTLVTTLNSDNAGNSKELLGPLSTGDLRKRLEQDRQATEQNVQSLKIEATATIKSSSVQDVTTDSAHTVVMAEVRGTSTNVPNGATNLMIFLLALSKENGKWLVASVDGPPGANGTTIDPNQSLPGTGGAATPVPAQPNPAEPAPAQPVPAQPN